MGSRARRAAFTLNRDAKTSTRVTTVMIESRSPGASQPLCQLPCKNEDQLSPIESPRPRTGYARADGVQEKRERPVAVCQVFCFSSSTPGVPLSHHDQ
jgi:hypothetical protein